MVQVVAVLIEHLSRASRKDSTAESFPAEPNFPLDVIPDPHDTPQGTRIPWGLDLEQIIFVQLACLDLISMPPLAVSPGTARVALHLFDREERGGTSVGRLATRRRPDQARLGGRSPITPNGNPPRPQ